jgi:glycosyltransferase involved in cell wall biosynthesis
MKIAFASDSYWPRISGMAVSIDTFKRELEGLGHEVHVLAPSYPTLEPAADEKAGRRNVHRFDSFVWPWSKEDCLVHFNQRARVHALLDELRPDVVHVHTEFNMSRFCWQWARANGVPVVFTAHTYWENYVHEYMKFIPRTLGSWLVRTTTSRIADQVDAVVVPTERMGGVLESYGVSRPMAVLPTGFQHDLFSGVSHNVERESSVLFQRHPQLRGKRVMLTVGRLSKEKNHAFLVEVLDHLKASAPNLLWLVVGDGPDRAGLERTIQERGLADRVVFTGYLDRDVVKHAFALADVFAFASKTETQGLVTVEAMSVGTPVVAIGEMGTADVMRGDNGGFMVPDDVGQFAARVADLLANPELHRAKAEEALRYSRRFRARALAWDLANLYRSTTALKPLAATPSLAA